MPNERPNHFSMNKKKIILVIVIFLILGVIFLFITNWQISRRQISKTIQKEELPVFTTSTPKIESQQAEPQPRLKDSPLGEFDPQQPTKTEPLPPEKVEKISKELNVFEITLSRGGIFPSEFTVKPNQTISLIVKAVGNNFVLQFKPPLEQIRVGVSADETRGISFITPKEKGDYIFIREIPGYENEPNPVKGIMRVR